MRKIICIGRQYGSGGHGIAKETASLLRIPCYDREILELAIKDSGIAENAISDQDEKAPNAWMYSILYEGYDKQYYGKITNDILFDLEKKIILEAAKRSDCIFVGRCADSILKQSTDYQIKSIFIKASQDARIREIMNRCSCDKKKAVSLMKKSDAARKHFCSVYGKSSWGEPGSYDFTFDSSVRSREEIIQDICGIYRGISVSCNPISVFQAKSGGDCEH